MYGRKHEMFSFLSLVYFVYDDDLCFLKYIFMKVAQFDSSILPNNTLLLFVCTCKLYHIFFLKMCYCMCMGI